MKAVSRWLDRFCYDHPNFGIPNLMKYIVIGNVMVYFLDLFSRGYASWMLSFSSPLILQGQVWRCSPSCSSPWRPEARPPLEKPFSLL